MSVQDYIRDRIRELEGLLQEFPEQSEDLLRAARQRFQEHDPRYLLIAQYFESSKMGISSDDSDPDDGGREPEPTHKIPNR